VLLLDIKMPGLNGLDVLKAVKAEKIDVEAVILTGYATVGDAVTAGGGVSGEA
jgi:two-component system response regulator HydG